MAKRKKLGYTTCPTCGVVDITDPNKFVIMYPQGLGEASAQITCEKCGLIYNLSIPWAAARKFDEHGCAVIGFSFARGAVFTEEDITNFMDSFKERMYNFLDGVYDEA